MLSTELNFYGTHNIPLTFYSFHGLSRLRDITAQQTESRFEALYNPLPTKCEHLPMATSEPICTVPDELFRQSPQGL